MRSHKIRVCMLIPSYFPLVGGSEVQLSGLLKKMDRGCFAPFVLTRQIEGTRSTEFENDTPIIRLPAPLRAGTFCLSAIRYLRKRVREFDVLHVHSLDSPALTGALIKRLCPEKRYIQLVPRFGEGSSYDRLARSRSGRARLRFVVKQADAVIPLCPDASDALQRFGLPPGKIAPIPNGVDTDTFAPAAPEDKVRLKRSYGIDEKNFVGVVTARLIPRKNVLGALRAWRVLWETYPASTLIVAGEGPEEARLRGYAQSEFSNRAVIFAGNVPRDEMTKILKTADAYISYSFSEGMSNAMLEGLSSGLPVVASRGPGIDQLVDHGRTGFLVDPDRPRDGAGYLIRLVEDRHLLAAMSGAARELIETRYSFEKIARDMEDLYLDRYNTAAPTPDSVEKKEEYEPAGV